MAWSLTRVTEPNIEPVTLDEIKAHSRVDFTDEDDFITSLAVAARVSTEEYCSRSLITQTWQLGMTYFPRADRIYLPRGPVTCVDWVRYTDATGVLRQLTEGTANDYITDLNSEVAEIVLPFSHVWPPAVLTTARPIVIQFTAGYGDQPSDIPTPIILAIKQLAASWFENRETYTVGRTAQAVVQYPYAYEMLLSNYRLRYPGPYPSY